MIFRSNDHLLRDSRSRFTRRAGSAKSLFYGTVCLVLGLGGLAAEEPPAATVIEAAETSPLEALWDRAVLIENPEGTPLRRLALTGRLNYDYANLDSNFGDYETAEFRRARLGFRASLYRQWELKGEVDLDLNEASPLYRRLTDAYLSWRPDSNWTVKLGKQAILFTLEGATGANELLTMERSNLANNLWFPSVFIPGLSADYVDGDQRYSAGLFSSGAESPEFGNFNASVFGLFKAGHDFADELGVDEALLSLHYVLQDPDPNNTFTRPNEQVISINFRYEAGPWGFQSDLARSLGSFAQPDLSGVEVMSFYDVNEQWQLVARAAILESDGPNGIGLARYENRLSTGKGDSFQEAYLGVNRYFYGHKLKWQSGVNFTRLNDSTGGGGDYEGWGLSSGIRISW